MLKMFIKMHGLGNDFVIFDARLEKLEIPAEKIRALADRHRGIGFDQMVILEPAHSAGTDIFMRLFNADGSEVNACGNATRCVGRFLMNEFKKDIVIIETKAGKLQAQIMGDKVTVDMGPALTDWQEIPLSRAEDTLSLPLSEGELGSPVAVNMGNPHAVFFVQDTAKIALETVGPKIERHALFPQRVNVEVAEVRSPSEIRVRVWERGAGITQACGTGACAVAVAGVRRGLTQRKVNIVLDGGVLDIEWCESDGHVLMTGDAVEVYRGEVEV